MYNFKIYYWSGKSNTNADALSRIPWETSEIMDSKILEPYVVKAIMMKSDQISWPLEESIIARAAHFFCTRLCTTDVMERMAAGTKSR